VIKKVIFAARKPAQEWQKPHFYWINAYFWADEKGSYFVRESPL
jgi:hypothetical protein